MLSSLQSGYLRRYFIFLSNNLKLEVIGVHWSSAGKRRKLFPSCLLILCHLWAFGKAFSFQGIAEWNNRTSSVSEVISYRIVDVYPLPVL